MGENKPGTGKKALVTLLLSLLAVGRYLGSPSPPRLWCGVAMLLSSLGDAALMSRVPGTDRTPASMFVLGAVFFLAAHLSYAQAYRRAARQAGVGLPAAGTAAAIALALAALAAFILLARISRQPALAALCLVYLAAIGYNCATVFSYALGAGGRHVLAAVGAAAFLLSDLLIGLKVLGVEKLRGPRARMAVWTLYPAGQLLLILFVV